MMPVKGRLSLGSTRPFQPVAVDPAERIIVALVQFLHGHNHDGYQPSCMIAVVFKR